MSVGIANFNVLPPSVINEVSFTGWRILVCFECCLQVQQSILKILQEAAERRHREAK
jgi:G:T-mismatch repair DNA endonuclease (very short patch repair protein)